MSMSKVASMAGVSIATVSRVINRDERVSSRAMRRVNDAIRKIGYAPPPADRRQGRRRRRSESEARARLAVFALVLPELHVGYYPSLLRGFSRAAFETGRQTIICETDNNAERQADVLLQLMDKGIAGIALLPVSAGLPPAHHVRNLRRGGVPLMLLHRGVEGATAPLLELPYEQIGAQAVAKMLAAGHRRIGCLITHRSEASKRYVVGIRAALEAAGHSLPDDLLRFGDVFNMDDAQVSESRTDAVLRDWLALSPRRRPTAIFSSYDVHADFVIAGLRRLGVSVPGQMSVVSFGGAWRSTMATRELASVTVDEEAVGRRAADLLDRMAGDADAVPRDYRQTIKLGFHEGATLGPPPRS